MTLFDLDTPVCAHGRTATERCPWCEPSTAVTRHEAAEAIKPSKSKLQKMVLDCIKVHPEGVTDQRIAELTGLEGNTARPRRLELERAGKIVASGKQLTRSGRRAVAYVVAS